MRHDATIQTDFDTPSCQGYWPADGGPIWPQNQREKKILDKLSSLPLSIASQGNAFYALSNHIPNDCQKEIVKLFPLVKTRSISATDMGDPRVQAAEGACSRPDKLADDFSKKQEKQHEKWVKENAPLGNADAEFSLGETYDNAPSTPQNKRKAIELFTHAAFHGNPDAACFLAIDYQNGDHVKKDVNQSQFWNRLATKNFDHRNDMIDEQQKHLPP